VDLTLELPDALCKNTGQFDLSTVPEAVSYFVSGTVKTERQSVLLSHS